MSPVPETRAEDTKSGAMIAEYQKPARDLEAEDPGGDGVEEDGGRQADPGERRLQPLVPAVPGLEVPVPSASRLPARARSARV